MPVWYSLSLCNIVYNSEILKQWPISLYRGTEILIMTLWPYSWYYIMIHDIYTLFCDIITLIKTL